MHTMFSSGCQVVICARLGPLAATGWRFGTKGYSARAENVMLSQSAIGSVRNDMGYPIAVGQAEAMAHAAQAAQHAKVAWKVVAV
jgi:alanine-glyoxylate transaminase/serine-glyoxylate transaminase/serine-pyruvate transaminase